MSPLWRYNNHNNIERICIAWRIAIQRLWKIPYRTHNALVHLINECNLISIILEKRRVKFLWNLLTGDNVLFKRICRNPFHNINTIGENKRYFIYKYNILYDDWFNDLNNIYIKIDAHILSISNNDNVCTAGASYQVLCEARDSGLTQVVNSNQLSSMIDLLCTK